MSDTTAGMLARAASASTLGAVELSVGEMQMPATPREMASCALESWVCALLWLSSAEKVKPAFAAVASIPRDR